MGAKAQNANDPPGKAAPEELETMYSAFQRSAQTVRDAVTNQNINEPQLGTAELKAAGALGGDLIANIRRRALAGELKVPDGDPKAEAAAKATRSRFARIAADSERAVFFAASALGAPTGDLNVNLGDKLQQGKDDDFAKDSLRLMGPNGILTGNPFNYPDDRFVK
jgi:hypothetical protein